MYVSPIFIYSVHLLCQNYNANVYPVKTTRTGNCGVPAITQIKPDKQSRQEVLRAYCPNINTVRLTQGQTQEDYVSSESIFPSFPSKVVPNFRAAKLVTINLKLGNLLR